jgi:hypothetical protein
LLQLLQCSAINHGDTASTSVTSYPKKAPWTGQQEWDSQDRRAWTRQTQAVKTGRLGQDSWVNDSQTGRLYDRSIISFHSCEAYFEVVH